MLVKLIRDARIMHRAGETVDVSPAEYIYLTSTGSAEAVKAPDKAEPKPRKRVKNETAQPTGIAAADQ